MLCMAAVEADRIVSGDVVLVQCGIAVMPCFKQVVWEA
jgi:hypothetical protein